MTTLVIDSGASQHLVTSNTFLSDSSPTCIPVQFGNSGILYSTHKGILNFRVDNTVFSLPDVLCVPGLAMSLLSVDKLSATHKIQFENHICTIYPSQVSSPYSPVYATLSPQSLQVLHVHITAPIKHNQHTPPYQHPSSAPQTALFSPTSPSASTEITTTPPTDSPSTVAEDELLLRSLLSQHPSPPAATKPAIFVQPSRMTKAKRQKFLNDWIDDQATDTSYPPKPSYILLDHILRQRISKPRELKEGETIARPLNGPDEISNLHRRLCHRSSKSINKLYNHLAAHSPHLYPRNPMPLDPLNCMVCATSKGHAAFTNKQPALNKNVEGLVHIDLVGGNFPTSYQKGYQYFMLIHDDASKCNTVLFMQRKSEAPRLFKEYMQMRERQTGTKIKRVRSDRGAEFQSEEWNAEFLKQGIMAELASPNNQSQNGVCERNVQTLMQMTTALMHDSLIPHQFWPWAVAHATNMSNLIPNKQRDDKIPLEIMYNRIVSHKILNETHIFGSFAMLSTHESRRDPGRFAHRAAPVAYMGVTQSGKALFYNPATGNFTVCNRGGYQIFEHTLAVTVIAKLGIPFSRGSTITQQNNSRATSFEDFLSLQELSAKSSSTSTILTAPSNNNPLPIAAAKNPAQPTGRYSVLADLDPVPAPAPVASPVPALNLDMNCSSKLSSTLYPILRPSIPNTAPSLSSTSTLVASPLSTVPRVSALADALSPLSSVALMTFPHHNFSQMNPNSSTIPSPIQHVTRELHPDGHSPALLFSIRATPTPASTPLPNFTSPITIPRNIKDALRQDNPDRQLWLEAINQELNGLEENNTFDRSQSMPTGAFALHFMWVFGYSQTKQKPKARIVARGDQQIAYSDYNPAQISSATCRIASIRILLALAAKFKWHTCQADVSQAFLQAELTDHTVWLRNPYGGSPLRLRKSLYGLRQAGCLWQQELARTLASLDYFPISADTCIFAKRGATGSNASFISVFVDDLVFFSSDANEIARVQAGLAARYKMFDLGNVRKLLGFTVERDGCGPLSISQESYAHGILERFGINLQPHRTPLPAKSALVLNPEQATQSEITDFQAAVGALLYLSTTSRPDISFALSTLSQFSQNPSTEHRNALQHLLGYVHGTIDYKLHYHSQGTFLPSAYADADHAACQVTRRSTTGCMLLVGDSLVHWFSRRQPTVTLSSTDAETVAATNAATEMVWLRQFFADIGIPLDEPSVIFCDNLSTIAASKQLWSQSKSKTIALRMCYLREQIGQKSISLVPISSQEQAADFLTKNTSGTILNRLLSKVHVGRAGC